MFAVKILKNSQINTITHWSTYKTVRNISLQNLLYVNLRSGLIDDENIQSSLWFTTLPSKEKNAMLLRRKKKKLVLPDFMPTGPPIISCKHERLNHYSGQKYDNLKPIPLASKGWYHRQSKGDYFTIRPTTDHPAFLMTRSDLTEAAGTFEEAGIDSWLIEVLKKNGKLKPTTIQGKTIPYILNGKNTLIVAETGCGKTMAYLLPMIQRIAFWRKILGDERPYNAPLGLIIVPNRELALQVGTVVKDLCEGTEIFSQTILGGHTTQLLFSPLPERVDIVVATLGVMSKLTTHRQYLTRYCKHLVLDEADTLLDDSFNEKLVHFLKRFPIQYVGPESFEELPRGTQVSLASATMPTSLDPIIGNILSMESLVKVSTKYLHRVLPHVPQTFLRVSKVDKAAELLKLVRRDLINNNPTMIFSNKAEACDWVQKFLCENGVDCERVHGGMRADSRLGKYERFKNGEVNVISCTDLTSRGVDTTRVKHVINFDFPLYMADYIHRCGRTGRIGHDKGCRITNLISSRREVALLHEIETAARTFKELHNVNNNIKRIIQFRSEKSQKESSILHQDEATQDGDLSMKSSISNTSQNEQHGS